MELKACYDEEANNKFEDDKALAWLKKQVQRPGYKTRLCSLYAAGFNGNESTLEGLIKGYIDKQAILTRGSVISFPQTMPKFIIVESRSETETATRGRGSLIN
ncbi:hypothetical protein CFP56_002157 [Quercus suber]|uniref:Uncharacterized protein n=1 Tax=Quercus suber TaxID=58331 RepID=A0AAW0M8S5_QUESU